MPSSTRTFSSRSRAFGQGQRGKEERNLSHPISPAASGLDLTETFFLLLCGDLLRNCACTCPTIIMLLSGSPAVLIVMDV